MSNILSILKTILFLYRHPLTKIRFIDSIVRWLRWQIATSILRTPVIYPFISGSCFVAKRGMTGVTGNIYTGLVEFHEMALLIHYLSSRHIFLDVGANVGIYTVIASKVCGAKTIAFEPNNKCVSYLTMNICLNSIQSLVTVHKKALGDVAGVLDMTRNLDTLNHITYDENESDLEVVSVSTLDDELEGMQITSLKIDVEGYEYFVLKGGVNILSGGSIEVIIIELNGNGERYGISDSDIHTLLLSYGYTPVHYDPFKRDISVVNQFNSYGNTIYVIRNRLGCIQDTVRNANNIRIHGLDI